MKKDDKLRSGTSEPEASVLASLRALLPYRQISLSEATKIAELQARRLLQLRQITDVPVPVEVVADLPRIAVEFDTDLPGHAASGASSWSSHRGTWLISINPGEPSTRQRFTTLHEYKHVIDHGHPGLGGRLPRSIYGLAPTEYVAEYFAGCALMPGRWVRTAHRDGIQDPADLAELFDVSMRAMEVRLAQLGLADSAAATQYRRQRGARGGSRRKIVWSPPPCEEFYI